MRRVSHFVAAALATIATGPFPALAACRQELAIYAEPGTHASLEFTPSMEGGTEHSFKVKFAENATILDGIVMWAEDVPRPYAIVMHECPQGDVTGEELEACTVWQGTIYSVAPEGTVGLLPRRGEEGAPQLLLPDFAAALRGSSAWGIEGLSKLPWEVFAMAGCQE